MDDRLLLVLIVVALAGLGWQLFRHGLGADLVIRRARGGRVSIRGPVPGSRHAALREFLGRDLATAGAFVVLGSRGPGRAWRFRWRGRLTLAERQRVRNFLLECLE